MRGRSRMAGEDLRAARGVGSERSLRSRGAGRALAEHEAASPRTRGVWPGEVSPPLDASLPLWLLLVTASPLPPLALPFTMSANKVKLSTSDQEEFDVERDVANRSVLIKNMLEGKSTPLLSPLDRGARD